MMTNVGNDGFGRLGRRAFKAIARHDKQSLEVMAINDLTNNEVLAYLLKYDSHNRSYPGSIKRVEGHLYVDEREITPCAQFDPSKLPWGKLGVDIVVKSTDDFIDTLYARLHLAAGVYRVVNAAFGRNADATRLLEGRYNHTMCHIVSAVSDMANAFVLSAQTWWLHKRK